MSNMAADFIDKIANSSLADARKKLPTLKWGKGHLLEYTDYDEKTNRPSKPIACALGIGELAACNKPSAIDGAKTISDDIKRSRLGRKGALATLELKQCPFTVKGHKNGKLRCPEKFRGYGEITLPAEGIVTHINDTHATSWPECKKMLKQIAKLERKAVAKAKKHVA